MNEEYEKLLRNYINNDLTSYEQNRFASYIKNYDFDELVKIKQENEVLKAKVFTYEEIIKKSNFKPFVEELEGNNE